MLPESKKDRIIFLGIIPILAAICGGAAGALIQAQSCSVVGATELRALIENAQMTGTQKLEFMKLYTSITDRPWEIVRSIVTYSAAASASLIGLFAAGGGFQKK